VRERFKRLGIDLHDPIITADTGYANEANMQYLHENGFNGYIPDNRFRSRDPKFTEQKTNHSTRRPITGKKNATASVIPATEFNFNVVKKPVVVRRMKTCGYAANCSINMGILNSSLKVV